MPNPEKEAGKEREQHPSVPDVRKLRVKEFTEDSGHIQPVSGGKQAPKQSKESHAVVKDLCGRCSRGPWKQDVPHGSIVTEKILIRETKVEPAKGGLLRPTHCLGQVR